MEDPLEPDLHYGLLTDVLLSPAVYEALHAIGEQILIGWTSTVAKDTGNLASTADLQMIKGGVAHPGDRWEAEFTAGGVLAPYAREIEERDHALENVLRALGYDTTGLVF